ncbi:MAG: murein hydrolase activator EnvC family protein [bacterium]|jgi:murein DD-endopeptidase MepM/ murein hydrolase activator NlpD
MKLKILKYKLIFIVFFFIFNFLYFNVSLSKDINEIKKELNLINQKLKESKKRLYYQNLVKKDVEKQLNETWTKIIEYESKIKSINLKIKNINNKITEYEAKINKNKEKIEIIQNIIDTKLNIALKYTGNWVLLSFAISSPDTLLDTLYLIKKTIVIDVKLVQSLSKEYLELEKNKKLLNEQKINLANYKNKLNIEQKYYNSLLKKRRELLAKYGQEISKTKQDIEYYEDIQKEKYEELQKYIVKVQSLNTNLRYTGGRLFWPTTSSLITSYFGYRVHPIYGTTRFHSGIDIGAPYGAPIYAAENGKVILASWYDGYGYCIIIDHGDGVSTLYAHCSSIIVKQGQYVSKGQVIGYVGSTGNSTGPHLHFEVRINGNPVNPFNYL